MRGNFIRALVGAFSIVLLFSTIESYGQIRKNVRTRRTINLWEAQLSVGMASLSSAYNLSSKALFNSHKRISSDNNLSIGLSIDRKITNVLSVGVEFLSGGISGNGNPDDPGAGNTAEQWAERSMSNTFTEFDFITRFDLINLFSGNKIYRDYSVFMKTGMGLISFKQVEDGFHLPKDNGALAIAVPIGLGARYDFSNNIGIRFNADLHCVATDQFDSLNENSFGNSLYYDIYKNISLGIVYTFGETRTRTSRKNRKIKQFWY